MPQTRMAYPASVAMPDPFRRRSARFVPAAVNDAHVRSPASAAAMTASDKVVWVYAVAAHLDPGQLWHVTGVDGEPVRAVAEADLSAVVGSVDATAFGEDSRLIADVAVIESIGRAHHDVVASVAADGPVVPLRLATVYPDDTTVRSLLVEHRSGLTQLLRSFSGTQEWGVKVYLELPADRGDGEPGAASSAAQDGLPGQEPRWQHVEECADEIDRVLSGLAVAARRHATPYLRFGGIDGWMVLNGVYLLDTDRAAEFAASARDLIAQHSMLRGQVTGPWPPYSFVDRQDA
jgi:Gas vesicle synthesis protein GvpL/GvpF